MEVFEETSVLLAASCDRTPHPLVVSLARVATSALGDASIDHAMTDLLLGMVVRRLYVGREQQVRLAEEASGLEGVAEVVWKRGSIQ